MRVQLPSRPGALGAVASALGAVGADINLVEIVDKRDGIEVDELILDLPPTQTIEALVVACDSLDQVQVEWVRNYPRGGGIDYDVDLHRRMIADSARAGELLVLAAPLVFRAQWAWLLDVSSTPRVIAGTPGAPALDADLIARLWPFDGIHRVVLEAAWIPGGDAHHAVVAPLPKQQVVVVARRGEPPFFRSELTRLAYLSGAAGVTDIPDQPLTTPHPQPAHRAPVARPLYVRRSTYTETFPG